MILSKVLIGSDVKYHRSTFNDFYLFILPASGRLMIKFAALNATEEDSSG